MRIGYRAVGLLTVLVTLALTITPATQSAQQPQSQLSPTHIQPVLINVTVTNKDGEFVTGLEPDDFEISIDKKTASIASLSNADAPASVGILIDSSGSMRGRSASSTGKHFAVVREALRKFLEASNQSNDYFLVSFNRRSQLLANWTSDHPTILEKVNELPGPGTALYDACYMGVGKLLGGQHTKRAMVIISDGMDNESKYTFNQVRELLKETNVLLYSIYFPANPEMGSSLGLEGQGILEELSSVSGGRLFFGKDGVPLKPKDLNLAFQIIATELRRQYAISIVPNESSHGKKWRKVKVKVVRDPATPRLLKGLTVRTREGFFSH